MEDAKSLLVANANAFAMPANPEYRAFLFLVDPHFPVSPRFRLIYISPNITLNVFFLSIQQLKHHKNMILYSKITG